MESQPTNRNEDNQMNLRDFGKGKNADNEKRQESTSTPTPGNNNGDYSTSKQFEDLEQLGKLIERLNHPNGIINLLKAREAVEIPDPQPMQGEDKDWTKVYLPAKHIGYLKPNGEYIPVPTRCPQCGSNKLEIDNSMGDHKTISSEVFECVCGHKMPFGPYIPDCYK